MGFLRDIWANKWIKLLALIFGLLFIVYLISRLRSVLTALAIAWVMAYICDPLVDRLERRRVPRTAGILILILGFVGLLIAAQVLILPQITHELQRLGERLPDYERIINQRFLPALQDGFGIDLPQSGAELRQLFMDNQETVTRIAEKIYAPIINVMKNSLTGLVNLVTGLLTLLVVPVAWFYLLRDIDRINAGIPKQLPIRWREPFVQFMRQVDEIISNFLHGQIIVAAILATLYSIGLWLILDIPLGLIIGLFAGMAAIIPYLGLVIGLLPAMVLAFLEYQDFLHPLGVVLVFTIAQALEGNLITPKVVGDKLGLHPVTVIFALLAWAELAGLFGMLIAVPLTAILQVLILRLFKRYQAGEFARRGSQT